MEILFTHFRRGNDSRYEKLISNIKGTVKRLDQETYFMSYFVFLELKQTFSLINISNTLTLSWKTRVSSMDQLKSY